MAPSALQQRHVAELSELRLQHGRQARHPARLVRERKRAAFTGTTEALRHARRVAQAQASDRLCYAVPLSLVHVPAFQPAVLPGQRRRHGLPLFRTTAQLNAERAFRRTDRDRNLFGETLRAGYELRDGFDCLGAGRALNQRNGTCSTRTSPANSAILTGWSVTGGSTLDLGGISKLEGFVGYSQQNLLQHGA